MGKFMGVGGLVQFWGDEFKNRWYAGVGQGFQLHLHDLRSRSGESEGLAILQQMQGKF